MFKFSALLLFALLLVHALAADPDALRPPGAFRGLIAQDVHYLVTFALMGGLARVIFAVYAQKIGWRENIRDFLRGAFVAVVLVALLVVAGQSSAWVFIAAVVLSGIEPDAALTALRTAWKGFAETISRSSGGGGGGTKP